MTTTLMVQGTSSDAGKSMLVAGLCRVLARKNIKVAPFKPQNMALNSAVTAEGGEIGRAQAVQAQAAGIAPHVDMNPILLKPCTDTGAQVIVHGVAIGNMQAGPYHNYKTVAMEAVLASHTRLQEQYEVIVVEGAGSPAEINLRDRDIANMGFAEAVDCPVIIVADIDRGGVFAQLVGTLDLLSPSEQDRVVGFVINKFRGDISLLEPGLTWLEARTSKPVLGVLPYLHNLQLAAEDAIDAQQNLNQDATVLKVVVPVFSRISNHTDFDMLRVHPQVDLQFAPQGAALPPCDLIILPGSKHVIADLSLVYQQGWDKDIAKHLRYGGKVLGICGGYQMLGDRVADPLGIEGNQAEAQGLGYLPIATTLTPSKQLTQDTGTLTVDVDGGGKDYRECPIQGYQIHAGRSEFKVQTAPLITLNSGEADGCVNADNNVMGCYLHGLFDTPEALQLILQWAGIHTTLADDYEKIQDREIDRVADALAAHLDWTKLTPLIEQDKA